MPRTCTICTHPQRPAVDKALAGGAVKRELAALYRVSPDAIERHSAAHLPKVMVKAQEAEDVRQALDVVTQLKAINAASLEILIAARKSGDGELALKAVDRIHKQIELQAKLLGELDERPQVNVLIAPEWHRMRSLLVEVLGPYPDARVAVAGALARLEGSSNG